MARLVRYLRLRGPDEVLPTLSVVARSHVVSSGEEAGLRSGITRCFLIGCIDCRPHSCAANYFSPYLLSSRSFDQGLHCFISWPIVDASVFQGSTPGETMGLVRIGSLQFILGTLLVSRLVAPLKSVYITRRNPSCGCCSLRGPDNQA